MIKVSDGKLSLLWIYLYYGSGMDLQSSLASRECLHLSHDTFSHGYGVRLYAR